MKKPARKRRVVPAPGAKKKAKGGRVEQRAGKPEVVLGVQELPDKRRIPYHKTKVGDYHVTYYGPNPSDDGGADDCRLVKRQKIGHPAKWSFYGPDVALLRGSMANQGAMQGRWDDPQSMGLLRALESVRGHHERMGDIDGATLRRALLDASPEGEARLNAARRAMKAGGLVREGELPRPWRISQAVVKAAGIHKRPPSAMEAWDKFREREAKIHPDNEEPDIRSFYRELKKTGWGWLLA